MLDRLNALLLSAVLVLAQIAPSWASQNALLSPTTGTVSGLQLTNNYNSALDSLNTANSGATAPTNQLSGSASLGNWWLNLTSAPYPLGMNDGSSNWPAIGWLDPTAHAWNVQIGGGAATLASASTVDLCSTPRNYLTISGTTTITSFGATCPAGVVKLVTFSGALILTYNATSLIIPGANNISPTVPGDQATLVSLGSGNWQVASYTPASGGALINPSIDVGDYIMTSLTAPPSAKYLFSYGQAVSRTTYAALLTGTTITQSVTRTTGSPTLTGFTDTTQIPTGAAIEGSGVPASDTILSCTPTTCTMAINATSSGTANVTIFPNGNGDGSTTFNLPQCQGVVLAGRPNMSGTPAGNLTSTYFGTNPNALGASGGSQSTQLVAGSSGNIPSITSNGANNISVNPGGSAAQYVPFNTTGWGGVGTGTGGNVAPISNSSASVGYTSSFTGSNPIAVTSNNTAASPTPVRTTQPTLTANCMIRVLAMNEAPSYPSSSLAANDDFAAPVADRRRQAA